MSYVQNGMYGLFGSLAGHKPGEIQIEHYTLYGVDERPVSE